MSGVVGVFFIDQEVKINGTGRIRSRLNGVFHKALQAISGKHRVSLKGMEFIGKGIYQITKCSGIRKCGLGSGKGFPCIARHPFQL